MNEKQKLLGECLSEFIGTAILILFGASCVAAKILAGATLTQWEIGIIWGLAVAMAIYVTGGVSGAHINPAVTITMATFGKFSWKKVIPYNIAQIAGAFVGAALAYFLYSTLFHNWENSHHIVRGSTASLQTAGIFSTYPYPTLSNLHACLVEVIITAMLLIGVMALTDDHNIGPKGANSALLIGLLVAMIGAATGPLTGFALNPARDFGPKLFTFFAGWGDIAFSGGRSIPYFWVPIIGPLIGGLIGGLLYTKCIALYLPANRVDNAPTK